MCPNCSDARLNPCICHKHANEYRERAEANRARDCEIAYWLADYRRGNRYRAEVALGYLGYVGPETSWDYETERGAL